MILNRDEFDGDAISIFLFVCQVIERGMIKRGNSISKAWVVSECR